MTLRLPRRPRARGQAKPFHSVPRINWAHPLAAGLVTYVYDCGGGFVIDLVTGKPGSSVQRSTGTAAFGATKYGSNTSTANVGGSTYWGYNFPNSPIQDNITNAAPYSFACGFVLNGNTSSNFGDLFCYCDASTTTPIWIGLNSTTNETMYAFNAGAGFTASVAAPLGVFATAAGVCATSTTGTTYHVDATNGFISAARSGLTLGSHTGFKPALYIDITSTSGTVDGGQQAAVFYGAAWKGRALLAADLVQLHNDPWGLLIYPEEIFPSLEGVAAVAAFLAQQNIINQAVKRASYF